MLDETSCMLRPYNDGWYHLCLFPQDAPVQPHVQEALARPRIAHALRPSVGSSKRIMGDLRSAKWSTRREERYRILSSHRAGLPTETVAPPSAEEAQEAVVEAPQTEAAPRLPLGDVQVVDLIHEEEENNKGPVKVCGVDLCQGTCFYPTQNNRSYPKMLLC